MLSYSMVEYIPSRGGPVREKVGAGVDLTLAKAAAGAGEKLKNIYYFSKKNLLNFLKSVFSELITFNVSRSNAFCDSTYFMLLQNVII